MIFFCLICLAVQGLICEVNLLQPGHRSVSFGALQLIIKDLWAPIGEKKEARDARKGEKNWEKIKKY